jgi:hypothetical protein
VDYSSAIDAHGVVIDKQRQVEYDELLATTLQYGDEPVRDSIYFKN